MIVKSHEIPMFTGPFVKLHGQDCIIVSLVREAIQRSNSVGFLADRRRMSLEESEGSGRFGFFVFF